jgi:predicted HicB family RNase H-like nuclease
MSTIMNEGYVAEIDIDQNARLLSGIVLNTRATLHFTGNSVDELRQAFADTIADYREWCKERGVEPERPYSGKLSLRIAPELHRRVAEQAAKAGESINQFISERLGEMAAERRLRKRRTE